VASISVLRFAGPAHVADPEALAAITGPIRAVEHSPFKTVGYTAARHERLDVTLRTGERRALVVKRIRPSTDWTACRTSDRRGREAAMLAESTLGAMWEALACPYLAFAMEDDEVALVMEDLTPHLFPDVRVPLPEEQEEQLLMALAALHARFWSSPALELPWLTQPEHYAGLLDACCAADPGARAPLPDMLREGIIRGWASALKRLPPAVTRVLATPAAEMAWLWAGLPRTLLHGDSKVANFAVLPNQRVAAIDWALLGAGPATLDVGWYLAVNATRLSRSKEDTLGRYRALLAARIPTPLPDALWEALVRAGIVIGARMLLWSKALAVEADRPGARAEWAWWVEHLDAACA
jgi:hypothetical protein